MGRRRVAGMYVPFVTGIIIYPDRGGFCTAGRLADHEFTLPGRTVHFGVGSISLI